MTEGQLNRFKLFTGVFAVNAAVGGCINPLLWNVYGRGMAVIVLAVMVKYQYTMFMVERKRRSQD